MKATPGRRAAHGRARDPLLEFAHNRRPPTVDEEGTMKNPLDSLWGTIISGLVLTAILYYVVRGLLM
jgi:hypothetical protein